MGSWGFSGLLRVASFFKPELASIYQLIDLSLPINEHFVRPEKIGQAVAVLNEHLLPQALAQVNDAAKRAQLFAQRSLQLPRTGLQDLLDHKVLSARLAELEKAVASKTVEAHHLALPALFSASKNESLRDRLQTLAQAEATPEALRLQLVRVLSRIYQRTAAPLVPRVAMRLFYHQDQDQLRLHLREISEAADEAPSAELPKHGFALDLDLAALNPLLGELHQAGSFRFCLCSDPTRVCTDSSYEGERHQIQLVDRPGFIWHQASRSHALMIRYQDGESSPRTLGLQVKVRDLGDNRVGLSYRVLNSQGGDDQLGELILDQMFAFLRGLHPVLGSILPADTDDNAALFSGVRLLDFPGGTLEHVHQGEQGIQWQVQF